MSIFKACAEFYKKEEDCKELAALSKFFEDIKCTKEGKAFLKSYQSIAPELLQKINLSESKQKLFA